MINIYVLLYSIFCCIAYVISILFVNMKIKKKETEIVLLILITLGALIAAFRPEGTLDTRIYNIAYQNSLLYLHNYEVKNFFSVFANRSFQSIELFYIMIMACFRYFFSSPVVFYFVQSIVTDIIMVCGLYLLCEHIYKLDTKEKSDKFICKRIVLVYSFYQMFCGVLYASSAIRDGLSISIGIFSIASLLTNKRKKMALALLLISVLIHTTSIVLLMIYAVLLTWRFHIHKIYIQILSILIPILYFIKIGAVLVDFFAQIVEKILQLFRIEAFYSYITQLDYRLPMREGYIIVLTCCIIPMITPRCVKADKYIAMVFMGLIMFVCAYPIQALARLLYIFLLFLLPLAMRKNRLGRLVYLIWSLYFVPQYVYVFGYLR